MGKSVAWALANGARGRSKRGGATAQTGAGAGRSMRSPFETNMLTMRLVAWHIGVQLADTNCVARFPLSAHLVSMGTSLREARRSAPGTRQAAGAKANALLNVQHVLFPLLRDGGSVVCGVGACKQLSRWRGSSGASNVTGEQNGPLAVLNETRMF